MCVREAVEKIRGEFVDSGVAPSYYEINNGLCEEFSECLLKALEPVGVEVSNYGNENFMLGDDDPEEGVWDWGLLKEHWGIAPPKGLTRDEVDAIRFGGHVWSSIGKKHYDAECPQGVSSFFDLPIFRRPIISALRRKGMHAPDVRTDDVIPAPLCTVPNPPKASPGYQHGL